MRQAASGVLCPPGMRISVPQLRHRTVFPRATVGTAKTFRQLMLGHIMRMDDGFSLISSFLSFSSDERYSNSTDSNGVEIFSNAQR